MNIEQKLYNEILNEIKENKDIYFSEIENIFERNNFDYEGTKTILDGENPSILIWAGWNQKAIDIIFKIFDNPHIVGAPLNGIERLLQGKFLNYPLAKRRKYKYKEPHWLPSKLFWSDELCKT